MGHLPHPPAHDIRDAGGHPRFTLPNSIYHSTGLWMGPQPTDGERASRKSVRSDPGPKRAIPRQAVWRGYRGHVSKCQIKPVSHLEPSVPLPDCVGSMY
jgi:hypothetical protein